MLIFARQIEPMYCSVGASAAEHARPTPPPGVVMRNITMRFAIPLLIVLVASACGARSQSGSTDLGAATTVRVMNQSFYDMNVYVLRSGQRIRLGTVNGNRTERFTLPRSIVTGSTPLQFMADPIGSSRTSQSFEIQVSPGDEISLMIPPAADG
jgi:hypothetical protein